MVEVHTHTHTSIFLCVAVMVLLLISVPFALAQVGESEFVPIPTPATAEPVTDPEALGFTVETIPNSETVIGDFVVGPGKVELTIEPGETQVVELSATNRTGIDRIFRFETEDAAGTKSGDQAIVLLGSKRGPYSLRDYLDIPKDGVLIKHGQRVRIPVRISIPLDAEPGGRYGSVLITTVTVATGEKVEGATTARSPLITRIGTLFFVTIPGDIDTEGELKQFTTIPDKSWFQKGPINFALSYENTGSIHLNPYGELSITNMLSGEEVGFVELDPWFAMPASLRLREISWNREFLLGKYTATVKINRGYDDIIDEASLTFWVFPWKYIAGGFAIVFLVVLLIRAFFRKFEFKRKI